MSIVNLGDMDSFGWHMDSALPILSSFESLIIAGQ